MKISPVKAIISAIAPAARIAIDHHVNEIRQEGARDEQKRSARIIESLKDELHDVEEELRQLKKKLKTSEEEREIVAYDNDWSTRIMEAQQTVNQLMFNTVFPPGVNKQHIYLRDLHRELSPQMWHNGRTHPDIKKSIGYIFNSTDGLVNLDMLDQELAAQNIVQGTYTKPHPFEVSHAHLPNVSFVDF